MDKRDDVLDWLERVNPVPDPGRLYEDPETSRLFDLTNERRTEVTMTNATINQLAREHGRPRVPRSLLVGAAAATLVVIVGAVLASMAASSVDVAGSDLPVLQLTIRGEDCTYEGPETLTPGKVEIIYHNASPETRWANTIRIDDDRTVQEMHDRIAADPLAGAPPWSTYVHIDLDVRASSSAAPVVRELEAGTHILLCGSSTREAIFGADILVTP